MTLAVPRSRKLCGQYWRHDNEWLIVNGHKRERCVRCLKLNPIGVPPEVRFWDHVDKVSSPIGCWLWVGDKINSGYGRFSIATEKHLAHRYAWRLLVGEIENDRELDHLCKVTLCVNPGHIEAVTHRENLRRAIGHKWGVCRKGHELKDPNLYYSTYKGKKTRKCRTCLLAYSKAHPKTKDSGKKA